MPYLLDANVFIEAKRRHYGLDFCPAFWEWLINKNADGLVFSIEKVGDELRAGHDELTAWATEHGEAFFLPPDEAVLDSLSAVATFLEDADYYLVSHAHAHRHVVVTHEVPSDGVRQVKIPDVAIGMRVKVMTPFEMLRLERARFILGRQS